MQFTVRAFERSHGHLPKGNGCWAFQEATAVTAFEHELVGEIKFFPGTLTQAKAMARGAFPGVRLVAVLP